MSRALACGILSVLVVVVFIVLPGHLVAAPGLPPAALAAKPLPSSTATDVLRCVSFSPYVQGYDPDTGPHPSHAQIDELLGIVVNQLGFHCVMTYGVLNGLDYVFEAAAARDIKVIAIIWLDADATVNAQSIEGTSPFDCSSPYGLRSSKYLPLIQR